MITTLVRFQQDADTVVVRVHADPAVVVQIADDEQRVVEATAAYLIARQSADDLTTTVRRSPHQPRPPAPPWRR